MITTRAAREARASLRAILRHARAHFDSTPPGAASRDVSPWTSHVLAEFRAGAAVTDRARARALRAKAADVAGYLASTAELAGLAAAFRGADPDAPASRAAAARFVGLALPDAPRAGGGDGGAPAPPAAAERYHLAERAGALAASADFSRLTGVANLKAQYFGLESLGGSVAAAAVAEAAAAAADAKKAAGGGAAGGAAAGGKAGGS